MKYLIFTEDDLGVAIGKALSKEISRYDIRAELKHVNKNLKIRDLMADQPDLLIAISPNPSRKILIRIRKLGVRVAIYHLSLLNDRLLSVDENDKDLLIRDRPWSDENCYLGNAVLDAVKSISNSSNSKDDDRPKIAIVNDLGVSLDHKSTKKMAMKFSSYKFVSTNLDVDFEGAIETIKSANVAIVMSNKAELVGLQLNCPMVRLKKSRIFTRTKNLSQLLDWRVGTKCFRLNQQEEASRELHLLLNDPGYCAGRLQDYQNAKDYFGAEPSSRKIAVKILKWMETA